MGDLYSAHDIPPEGRRAEIERLRREVMRLSCALLRIRDDADSLHTAKSIAAFAAREGAALKMERNNG